MSSITPARSTPGSSPGRARRLARLVAPTVAAATVATLAFAAFTDDAQNNGNSATAANIVLTEDVPSTSPLFSETNWIPGRGDTYRSRCIGVTNGGSESVQVKLRLAAAPTGALADYVDVMIMRGTRDRAVDSSSCSTFRSDPDDPTTAVDEKLVFYGELDELPTSTATALPDKGNYLAAGEERAYLVKWTLQDDEAAEGKSVGGVDFRWETTTAR